MTLINENDQAYLTNEFAGLKKPVKLIVFSQEFECQYCHETRQIAEEITALSDKLSLELYDFVADKEIAEQYNIDKIPATVVMEKKQKIMASVISAFLLAMNSAPSFMTSS